jgi:hypothetical protein
MTDDEDAESVRLSPGEVRMRWIDRRRPVAVAVRRFGFDIPRMWSLNYTPTLLRWPDRLPGKLRQRLWHKRGKLGNYSDAHLFNFTIYKRKKSKTERD